MPGLAVMIPSALVALRVAVLHCDTTPMYGSFTPQMFRDLLPESSSATAQQFQLIDYNVQAQEYPEWDDVDAVVITGSVASAYDKDAWIERLAVEIRLLAARAEAKRIRILGVCFGHQMLARALGGEVTPHPQGKFFGVRRFLVSAHAQQGLPWCKAHMTVFYSHGDVVSRLPPGAQPLGCSARCGVEGMCVGTHILSLQGHPEFSVGGSSSAGLRCVRALASHMVSKGMTTEEGGAAGVSAAEAGVTDAAALQRALLSFLCTGLQEGPLFAGGAAVGALQPIIGFGSLLR